MKAFILISILVIVTLLNNVNCIKIKNKTPLDLIDGYKQRHSHKTKIVHYAFKTDSGIKVSQIGVKNLEIEVYDDWIAKALWFGDEYNTTGWSLLEIETNEKASDSDQAFSAGLLEGQVTRELMSLHLINTVGDFCPDITKPSCSKLVDFLNENFKWISSQITQHPDDPYWHHVGLVFSQFNGLYYGYNSITADEKYKENILTSMITDIKPYLNLLALQLNGDMGELLASFSKISNPFYAGSCSALIKLLPNNQDLFTSHVTWTEYESMLRILKHYKFNYHLNNIDPTVVPGSDMSFSSYPGILSSIDDFYVIKSGLTVLETTIGNSNADLWKYVTTNTNLYWIRNMIANRLSFTAPDWAKWFSLYNSGTYNNEWMVVDYKLFYPGEPLKDNLFVVLEQIPGQVAWSDKTDVLRKQSYWSSYNIAYYPEIYNISGTYDAFLKYGTFFSYDDSPRANIFRRDHSKVTDIQSMINLMRYNNYTEDPFSKCDCDPPYSGENTISARSDLNPANGKYPFEALGHRNHGATDMKLTTWSMSRNLEFIGISGPTHNDYNVPPFAWSQSDFGNTTNHFGLPDKWIFNPFHVQWKL